MFDKANNDWGKCLHRQAGCDMSYTGGAISNQPHSILVYHQSTVLIITFACQKHEPKFTFFSQHDFSIKSSLVKLNKAVQSLADYI
jgi:hypothetical protein